MAPQPLNQTVASSPSTAPASSADPGQHEQINLDFIKDEKCKTSKCKLCNSRVTSYAMRCAKCSVRICSECIEADGDRAPENKVVADDYINQGCWCGFKNKFNPAFKDRLPKAKPQPPPAAKKQPAAKKTAVSARATRTSKKNAAAPGVEEASDPTQDSAAVENLPEKVDSSLPLPPTDTNKKTSVSAKSIRSTKKAPMTTDSEETTDQSQEFGDLEATREQPDDIPQAPPAEKKDSVSTRASKTSKTKAIASASQTVDSALDEPQKPSDPPATAHQSNESSGLSHPPTIISEPKRGIKRRNDSSSPDARPESLPKKQKTGIKQAPPDDINIPKRCTKRTRGSDPELDNPVAVPPPKKQKAAATRGTQNVAPETTTTGKKNIIIIGAGVIGLFIAYELATKTQNETDHTITVVDINEKHFALASGHCSGFVSIQGVPDDWLPLLEASIPAWNELLDSTDFRKIVAATAENYSFEGKERGHDIPWFHSGSSPLVVDEETSCRIRSPLLGNWLHGECERLGVQFKFNMHPVSLQPDKQQMRLNHATGGKYEMLSCHDIVLAAGPFTGELFSRLYKESSIKLLSSVRSSEWATLPAGGVVENNVGILLSDATAAEANAFEAPIALVSRRSTGTVKISACRKPIPCKKLLLREAVDPRPGRSAELREVAAKHLVNPPAIGTTSLSSGSAWVSTCRGEKPVVGSVPGLALDQSQGRVYVAYGFGNFGTTVAPGVGSALAAMIRGEETGVDLGDFGVREA